MSSGRDFDKQRFYRRNGLFWDEHALKSCVLWDSELTTAGRSFHGIPADDLLISQQATNRYPDVQIGATEAELMCISSRGAWV